MYTKSFTANESDPGTLITLAMRKLNERLDVVIKFYISYPLSLSLPVPSLFHSHDIISLTCLLAKAEYVPTNYISFVSTNQSICLLVEGIEEY